MRNVIVVTLVLVLCGCAASTSTGFLRQSGETAKSVASEPGSALPGAIDDSNIQVVELPALERWPRTMHSKSPFYGQVQLSPYVGQFGVVADMDRADAGSGFGATVGYWFPIGGAACLGLEAVYEASEHWNASSGVDAQATRTGVGLRASFRMDEKSHPFIVAGAGKYDLAFDSLDPKFDLSGMGGYLGGGFEYSPSQRFSAHAELRLHVWDATEEASGGGGIAETLVMNLGAAVSF